MDYQKMLEYHLYKSADLTVACVEIEKEKAHHMGVMEIDDSYRIVAFQEKPQRPKPIPSDPQKSLVSMGIYVFNTEILVREIIYDAKRDTQHDFGKNIIPRMIKNRNAFAYDFRDENKREVKYWRDVGSIDSYYEANMELLQENPVFDLYDQEWPIRTYHEQSPPSRIVVSGGKARKGCSDAAIDSLVSNGCEVNNGVVRGSVLSPFVQVGSNACVEDSILMRGVKVEKNARIRRAIIDEGITVPPHYHIGYDLNEDSKRFSVTESGIVVIPQASILD
jgi:glucose-1-phosphate adenylyltransferase